MYEDMRVKYLFIDLRYPTYVKMQIGLIIFLLVMAALFFIFLGDHRFWFLRYLWVVFLVGAPLEVLESVLAIRKAKKEYQSRNDDETGY